jgi:hypothetical protein
MPSKRTSQDVEIKITLAGPEAPERLLANGEMVFQSGLPEGLRVTDSRCGRRRRTRARDS